ncbi:sensor histidine kinase [Actinomadura sp. HBU206391]|uniref:sensor histidine kinase n=1 Tax=Actinomadura sp. HBU206391 TaxID=2731692 RepID=UPI0016502C5E|nr:HAMP domain-containing sensor histidine kinase [Actinomadura sp. HBU206391]MBC6462557.1 HAMP domain-containing histidine kinase [Actinomadura sp. HBU206391]
MTLLATLLLIPAGVGGGLMARQALTDAVWRHVRQEAAIAAVDVRHGQLSKAVTPRVAGVNLIQVVGRGHHVIAASAAARGLPPMTEAWPPSQNAAQDVQSCARPPAGCTRITAVRVGPSPDSPVVYAGRRAAGTLSAGVFDTLFAVQVAALIALTAWATWRVTGRILRPVEAIRTELAAISVSDLSGRVPEPPGRDEIARLARTINTTLTRMEHAQGGLERMVDQQQRFASDASHELRNPIAGLRALLEETRLNPDPGDLSTTFQRALDEVDRLQAITNDLLLLARVQADAALPPERMDLGRFVSAEISRRADRHETLLSLQPGVTVRAVPVRIGRILASLLDNAQRHAENTVQVEVRDRGGLAELSVSDDGEGIAEADHERIFEHFIRLPAARNLDPHGTGLGLPIARAIAQAHNGSLHAEASPTGGARFVLRLPYT